MSATLKLTHKTIGAEVRRGTINLLELGAQQRGVHRLVIGVDRFADLLAQPRAGPTQMRLQDWPTFMRLGTPSGLSTMSTGVPSARNGMSSCGVMRETTPLLP